MQMTRKERLQRRHNRVRRKVSGTAERPRLYVRRTLKHVYAQIIDDSPITGGSKTIAHFSSSKKDGKHTSNKGGASELGKVIAADLNTRGIKAVVFDRGGYRYHGVVKAVADAVREGGVTI